MRGLIERTSPYPSPIWSITPGRKLSTSTSAFDASLRTSSRSWGSFALRVTLSLLRLMLWKFTPSPSYTQPSKTSRREPSPPSGRSILITRAPRSASRSVADGPARYWQNSRTRIPSSGLTLDQPPILVDSAKSLLSSCIACSLENEPLTNSNSTFPALSWKVR